jgi:SnoaL-like domain
MDAELQEIIDTHKIRKVLNRYSRGIDRVDIDLVMSIYHDDAMDYHGSIDGPAADFARVAMKSQKKEICTSHMIGQSDIVFDGSKAFVETYFFGTHLREKLPNLDDGPYLLFMSGRYIDRFENRTDEWLIAERRVLQDWVHVEKFNGAGIDLAMFHRPQQSKDDHSYIGRES